VRNSLVAVAVCMWLSGCMALSYPPRDPKINTPQPVATVTELLEAPLPPAKAGSKRAATKFEIRSPQFVFEGHSFWLDCRIPQTMTASRLTLGFGDEASYPHFIRGGERAREGISNRLRVDAAPCGTFMVVCALSTGEQLTKPLLVKGRCNTDSSGEW